jgi:hypothetical protein
MTGVRRSPPWLLLPLGLLALAAVVRSWWPVVLAQSCCLIAAIWTGGFGFSPARWRRYRRSARQMEAPEEGSGRGVIIPLLNARLERERARRVRHRTVPDRLQPLPPSSSPATLALVRHPSLRLVPGGPRPPSSSGSA